MKFNSLVFALVVRLNRNRSWTPFVSLPRKLARLRGSPCETVCRNSAVELWSLIEREMSPRPTDELTDLFVRDLHRFPYTLRFTTNNSGHAVNAPTAAKRLNDRRDVSLGPVSSESKSIRARLLFIWPRPVVPRLCRPPNPNSFPGNTTVRRWRRFDRNKSSTIDFDATRSSFVVYGCKAVPREQGEVGLSSGFIKTNTAISFSNIHLAAAAKSWRRGFCIFRFTTRMSLRTG